MRLPGLNSCFKNEMQKTIPIIRALLASLFAALATSCGNRTEITPAYKNVTEAVYASGNIRPKFSYKAAAAVGGRIVSLYVEEGDSVNAGQPLFALRSEATSQNTEAARARLELARKNARADSPELAAARAQIDAAKQKLQMDSLEYARYKRLVAKEAAPRRQLDAAETMYKVAREQLAVTEKQYRSLQNRLETEKRVAESQFRAAASGLEEYAVASETDGLVLEVFAEPGELAAPMQPVVEIGDPTEMLAEIYIDEADVALVKTGQTVALKPESGGPAVKGTVAKIFPSVNEANRTVRAEVVLPKGDYVPGVSAEANIIIRRKENALVLPRAAVLAGDSVWVRKDGETIKIKVETGARDLEYVEITGGLSPETVALLPE